MPLPKMSYPFYSTKVPSTGKSVKFRPYTVSEEKILLMAAESKEFQEISNATRQVISATFENLDVDSLTTYDVDYLFLQLRIKSVSPTVELFFENTECKNEEGVPCNKKMRLVINLEDVGIQEYDEEADKFVPYTPKKQKLGGYDVKLSDTVGVIMKHPGFREKELFNQIDNPTEDDLVKLCIIAVYDENSVYTRDDFTEEELNAFYDDLLTESKQELIEFINNIPSVRYESEFKCSTCGYTEKLVFDTLESFFI